MIKKTLVILVIINTVILFWGVTNYILLTEKDTVDVKQQITETPPLALQTLEIVESYTEEQKTENVDKIIKLYSKTVKHLDATSSLTIEIMDTIVDYLHYYIAVSLINIMLLLALYFKSRHNKSINGDR